MYFVHITYLLIKISHLILIFDSLSNERDNHGIFSLLLFAILLNVQIFLCFCFPVFFSWLQWNTISFFWIVVCILLNLLWRCARARLLYLLSSTHGTPWLVVRWPACLLALFDVLDTFHCNITFFRCYIMVSHRSHFTISTNQILFILHRIWKANIFKGEHIIHRPIAFQQFTLRHRLLILLMHHG